MMDLLNVTTIIEAIEVLCGLVLIVGAAAVCTVRELGSNVERQFRRHDQDLRAEVEQANRNFDALLRKQEPRNAE